MGEPKYVLITINEFGRGWEDEETAECMAGYLSNEFDNQRIIETGHIHSFEGWDALAEHIKNVERVYNYKENTDGDVDEQDEPASADRIGDHEGPVHQG